jgi:hypothetical protein
MDPISEFEARRMMDVDGDEVVRPWEQRTEVIEAGLDDTTAPDPGADTSNADDGATQD